MASLRYVNCGHNPPLLLRRDGSLERLAPTAMVVGLVDDWTAVTGETILGPGDLLAIYSDGLTEATDRRREVFDEVRGFSAGEQADDQTLGMAHVS